MADNSIYVDHPEPSHNQARGAITVLLTISCSTVSLAADYLPVTSTLTGQEIARAYRTDGSFPNKALAADDKRSCLEREVPKALVDRLSTLDRQTAEIEITKAVIPCMAKKGWRIEISSAGAPSIVERSTIAVVDAALDKVSSSLPRQMDEHSDLVGVKRDKTDIVYTIKFRAKSQGAANELRRFASKDPRAAEVMNKSLMKQSLCEPQPNMYLKAGFTVVWEAYDERGLVWRTRLIANDCS
jgi:hypothetical protein